MTKKEFQDLRREIQARYLHNRYQNKNHLQKDLSEFLNKEIKLSRRNNDYFVGCDFGLSCDVTIDDETDLYITIFYIKDRQEQLYITEIWVTTN